MQSPEKVIKIKNLIYSRTCGYFAPVAQMNPGKREEFADRKMINIEAFKK